MRAQLGVQVMGWGGVRGPAARMAAACAGRSGPRGSQGAAGARQRRRRCCCAVGALGLRRPPPCSWRRCCCRHAGSSCCSSSSGPAGGACPGWIHQRPAAAERATKQALRESCACRGRMAPWRPNHWGPLNPGAWLGLPRLGRMDHVDGKGQASQRDSRLLSSKVWQEARGHGTWSSLWVAPLAPFQAP